MKKLNLLTLIFVGLLLTVSSQTVNAQDEPAPTDAPVQNFNEKARPNLLAELDLSNEQIRQIRRINREIRPLAREAKQRMLETRRILDESIYSDNIDDSTIQARLKEAQIAQAELIKINSMTEFAVRKVLSPEQLVKFRAVRQRFAEKRENRLNQMRNRQLNNQNQQFNNRQRNLRPNN